MTGTIWKNRRTTRFGIVSLALLATGGVTPLRAEPPVALTSDANSALPGQPPAVANSPAPSSWASGITFGAQFDAGIIANPARPRDGQNFGDIFTDHANQVQLNQLLVTLARIPDPSASGYDFGFDLTMLYGSDARAEHYLGQFDMLITNRYQLDIVQADILAHLPWLTSGGVDVKLGEFPGIIGMETLNPSTTPFYSHSLMYDWGQPAYNTGIITTTHLNKTVDIYLGIDTGNTTTFGAGDNNHRPSGYAGIGLNNLFNNTLTIVAATHMGPEQALRADPNANSDMHYVGDILATWSITKNLTSNTEFNYVKEDSYRSEAYGFAQYFSYPLSDATTFNLRGEVWRASNSNFVVNFERNTGFVQSTYGNPAPAIVAPPTTYSSLTVGVTFRPKTPKPIRTFMLRPEIRYERSLNGTRAFNAGRDMDAFLFGGDVVLGF